MIPVRLALRDFLSYAAPKPVDFEPFRVACLSGDNGVGKSALLDAITWSIWGCARGCEGGQNQDRLIRDGADATSVDLTFDLGSARYRIVRRRSRAAKAELQFLVQDGEGWMNIAGETLKETDAKIAAVLRMDYRTFAASAFFLQGRSDDFLARMKPDERKDVFARLLDLGTYEKLEDEARQHAREADGLRKDYAIRIDRIVETLPDVAELETTLEELAASMKDLDERSARAAGELRAAQDVLSDLRATAATLAAEREALAAAEGDIAELATREAALRRRLAETDELLARADEVEEALAEAEALSVREVEARRAQERAAELDARRAELVTAIDGERRTIEARCEDLRDRVASYTEEIVSLERAKEDLAALDAALAAQADPVRDVDEARALLQSQSEAGARLKEQIANLELVESKGRRNLEVLADGGGECPVCSSALDSKHRAKVKRDIETEIKDAAKARAAANAELEVARKEAKLCMEEIQRLDQAATERAKMLAERAAILGRLERLDVAIAERARATAAITADASILAEGAFATEERALLETLEAESLGLYDREAHAALRERLEEFAAYRSLAGQIGEAVRNREIIIEEIGTVSVRSSELARANEARAAAVVSLTDRLDGLEGAEKAARDADTARERLVHAAADAAAEHGRVSERLLNARTMTAELEQARVDERAAADRHRRYRRLVEAFGRGGIPDLIIDNALPELEGEANHILGRLSDHEMSVHFVLQRDTKSGKVKETFDALVHHDGGVRDFAMFSGGEAFRVAFAVRLAMSKLLVRRSGARLETLVIDEGFGTQDPEGRERLVEAINLAREEFGKVLVITHLDDLKDQFGTQIRVTKERDGSALEVLGS